MPNQNFCWNCPIASQRSQGKFDIALISATKYPSLPARRGPAQITSSIDGPSLESLTARPLYSLHASDHPLTEAQNLGRRQSDVKASLKWPRPSGQKVVVLRAYRVKYNLGRLRATGLNQGCDAASDHINTVNTGIRNGSCSNCDTATKNIHHIPVFVTLCLREPPLLVTFQDGDRNVQTALGPSLTNNYTPQCSFKVDTEVALTGVPEVAPALASREGCVFDVCR
ncbi:hypothetical protein HYQ46_005605 [Verticillium longisporum]|nr:hypothetical protein HYQ46_005605 [Verticillium longisporum]